jgi:DALR domain
VPLDFVVAMNDDLGTPEAVAVLHNAVREGNLALDAGDLDQVARRLGEVAGMLAILGLDADADAWQRGSDERRLIAVLDGLVTELLKQRAAARERRDFAAADAIRSALADLGVEVSDTPQGPRWSLSDATPTPVKAEPVPVPGPTHAAAVPVSGGTTSQSPSAAVVTPDETTARRAPGRGNGTRAGASSARQ